MMRSLCKDVPSVPPSSACFHGEEVTEARLNVLSSNKICIQYESLSRQLLPFLSGLGEAAGLGIRGGVVWSSEALGSVGSVQWMAPGASFLSVWQPSEQPPSLH